MTAASTTRARGPAIGVTPDDPEPETYHAGDLAVWHGPYGPIDVVTLGQDDCWVDIVPDGGEAGLTVSERELSPR